MPTENQHRHGTFSKRTRLALALAAVVAGLLLAVPGAHAETYCVGAPADCTGIDMPGNGGALQEAFDQAAATNESDHVRIGPGTYIPAEPGGWEITSPGSGIHVRGEGPTKTILQGTGVSGLTLMFSGPGGDSGTLEDLGLRLSDDGGTPIGLLMSAAGAARVVVTAPAGLTAGLGVRLGWQSHLESTRVITPGLTGVETIGDASVNRSFIAADVGVTSTGGMLLFVNSRIEAKLAGIVSSVPAELRSTLVHVSGGTGTEIGVVSRSAMTATHVTVVGGGDAGLGALAYKKGGGSASLTLANSTVTGFEHDLSAGAEAPSLASMSVSYSNYSSKLLSPGGSIDEGNGNVDVDPGFVNPARADFHLRHDSPLIDMGDDIVLPGEIDLDGELRVVDGDGMGGLRADLGALEYQHRAPLAAISGPDSATAGQTLELSGAASSDPDPGDALTYAWWFGDGTKAAGADAAHAYAAPGTYPVTLQVTDPTGQQATVTKEISVQAQAQAPAPVGGGTPAGDAPDSLAPVISRLRVARARRLIRFRLSEPARVTIRLTRARTPRVSRAIRISGRQGANRVRLSSRLARALGPGRHRIRVSARDAAGNQARPRTVRLVLRPR
jgi:PKD domain